MDGKIIYLINALEIYIENVINLMMNFVMNDFWTCGNAREKKDMRVHRRYSSCFSLIFKKNKRREQFLSLSGMYIFCL